MKSFFTVAVLLASVLTAAALPGGSVDRDGVQFDKRQCGCSGGLFCCISGESVNCFPGGGC
jgi:hypothetical protein